MAPAPLRTLALLLAFLFAGALAQAADNFPPLSGRVVDSASVLSEQTRSALESKLSDLETKSGIQFVVATVPSLGGQEIEPYANNLFRFWKLGEAKKNNGLLLLVAPTEHRVRIEVGYGLEGTLTDALSKVIIVNAMAPKFKAGDFNGGIARGVDDIVTVLTTDSSEWQAKPQFRAADQPAPADTWILIILFVVIFFILVRYGKHSNAGGVIFMGTGRGGGFGGGGFGGGGFGGGGFSGGGGSSGGGGASGGW